MPNKDAAIEKLSEALILATRELAHIATLDENAPQASIAAGAQLRAKSMMEEALALLQGDD
jgi:hypothetical protein